MISAMKLTVRLRGNRLFIGIVFTSILLIFLLLALHMSTLRVSERPKEKIMLPALKPLDDSKLSERPREKNKLSAFKPLDDSKRESFMCNETFNRTLEDNLKIIQNYPKGIADDFLWTIGANMTEPFRMKNFPVFVTAFDKSHYAESQGLFQDLHKRFMMNPKYKHEVQIIVYDLGMTERQLNMVQQKCKCEIRRFPFEQFPPHVRTLKTYAFKPIIVQQLLMEHGFVWWMDSSIRFKTDDIDSAILYAKEYSMLYTVTNRNRVQLSLTRQTDIRTFEFLGEDRCKFRPFGETWATTVMFHYDKISRAVVQAWASCAVNMECIAPTNSLQKLFCDMKLTHDGRCHRFDQSALSIITRRLFHEQNSYPLDITLNDIYAIKYDDIVSYFESCVPMDKCLL